LRRQLRLAIVVAVLIALGLLAISHDAWVAGLIALAAGLALIAAFLAFAFFPARIPRDSVLMIRLSGRMREHSIRSPLDQLMGRGFPSLHQLRRALEAARIDASVSTAIVEIAGLEIGLATASEIHDLLSSLRTAGKRVVAILTGDNATVREYLAASGAGEVIANPDLGMMMLGVAAGSFFLKGALAKMHIEAQTLQYKEYKGAAEMFNRDAMSPELRESLEAIVADWQLTLAGKVAAARKIDPERARRLLGEGFISAETARETGLIDRAGYVEDLEAELDPEGRAKRFVSLARYLRRVAYARRPAKARIALIHALGPVVAGEPPFAGEYLSGPVVAAEINRVARDRRVRAIVLRVNSPGGSAVGSDLVWRATLEARRRGKPLVVSMGDVAGSGGYYVAMAADAIVAEPATVTGSIGVVYSKLNLGGLLAELGIRVDYAKSDPISDALSASRALTEAELAQLDKLVGELYATFTKKVADGRKLGPERTEEVARGRVWTGRAARESGLVDDLGGLERAIQIAREKAGLRSNQPHELVTFPESTLLSGLRLALMPTQMPLGIALAAKAMEIPTDWAPAMLSLLSETRALLLCPLF
jgi:protease IV